MKACRLISWKEGMEMRAGVKTRPPLFFVLLVCAVLALLCAIIVCAAHLGSESGKEPEFSAGMEPSGTGCSGSALENARLFSGEVSREPEGFTQLSDPLLVLVNSETPLPDDWEVELVSVNDEEQVDARMYDDFMAMISAAGQEDVWFWVASGYRSVESQQIILEQGVSSRISGGMGEEEAREDALRTIQRPGHSEHHTGLAVDLNDVSDDFENTPEYRWLSEHAAEYGFIQRYRKDKAEITGIDNESWHYRYVGREHARRMRELDMCLEEYVAYLKSQGAE